MRPPANYAAPIYTYPTHVNGTCAVTSGYVSRDAGVSETLGKYVFADFCAGALGALTRTSNSTVNGEYLGRNVDNVSSFGEDALCRLYVASLGGAVYRLGSDNPTGRTGCQGSATTRRDRKARSKGDRDQEPQLEPPGGEPAPTLEPDPAPSAGSAQGETEVP